MDKTGYIEVSFVIPCLNEEKTLAKVLENCHETGLKFKSYELIVADNGSSDNSINIAKESRAQVVNVKNKGYGSALKEGLKQAIGEYVVMGDADLTYDFADSINMIQKLKDEDTSLVMGNRFLGTIEKGAMPMLHKYIGNPILTLIGKVFFGADINDFHCGLRAFVNKDIKELNLKSQGMEFASEMVIRACLAGLKLSEVSANLRKDHPERNPHLRTWRDGWRHLKFMFSFSPKYTYFPLSLFFIINSILVFILNLTQQVPFSGTNSLAFSVVLYVCGLWASSEYISSRLLLATKIKYKNSFFSDILFKFVRSRSFLDRSFQIVLFLISIAITIIVSLYIKSNGNYEYFSERSSQLKFYISMILSSTSLYIYLVASKINTFSWLHDN